MIRQDSKMAFLVAQLVKNPPAMRETWVQSLGDPLERAWQPTPAFLPGESPWTEEPGGLKYTESQRVWHDSVTKHSIIPMLKNSKENCSCNEWKEKSLSRGKQRLLIIKRQMEILELKNTPENFLELKYGWGEGPASPPGRIQNHN